MPDATDLGTIASEGDLEERVAATISAGCLDTVPARLTAHYLVGGNRATTDLGNDKPGSIDLLIAADAAINTSQIAVRIDDLAEKSYKANGSNATRAGLIGSVRGSEINKGPALNPEVDHLIIESFDELKSDYRAAFKEILDNRTYTFTTESVRDQAEAPGANLFIGNPTYGNFDEFEPLGKQIPAEPTIISGVDVIAAATGKSPLVGDPLNGVLAKSAIQRASGFEPGWTEESQEAYQSILAKVENRNIDPDQTIAVHPARCAEAIRKLSESTAKYRFSNEVSHADVRSAWNLYVAAYEDWGVYLMGEEGEFDPDLVEQDVDHSEVIQDIVRKLEGEYEEGAPVTVVLNEALDSGLSKSEAENGVMKAKQTAKVYEPRSDHLRST